MFTAAMALAVTLGAIPLGAEVRVSQAEALRAATNRPTPEYTAVARQMKVVGKVEVEVAITPDGKVEDVKIVSGNPLLTRSAAKAVKDWTFTPFKENGQPAKANVLLSFDFKP